MMQTVAIWLSEHIILPIVLIMLSIRNLNLHIGPNVRGNLNKVENLKEIEMIKDLELVVSALQGIVTFIEKVDPNAANNQVIKDIQRVLDFLKTL